MPLHIEMTSAQSIYNHYGYQNNNKTQNQKNTLISDSAVISNAGASSETRILMEPTGDRMEIGEKALQMNAERLNDSDKTVGKEECKTCAGRKYVDGSNDLGVSFKSPRHISPEASASTVMAHENEHVRNRRADAEAEGKKIVSQSVQIFTSICPECGRAYVSGGKTRTVMATDPQKDFQYRGQRIDQYA